MPEMITRGDVYLRRQPAQAHKNARIEILAERTFSLVRFMALAGATGLGACSPRAPYVINRVPIVLTTPPAPGSDEIGGMIVPIMCNRGEAALAIDTGSALTFLYTGKGSAAYTPHAGSVRIGRETMELPGRNFEASDETGTHIVGVLGADFLLTTTTEFNPHALTITRFLAGYSPDTHGWITVPMEDIQGHIILTLTIDGRGRRLLWDTGSPHVLLVGEGARPGDATSLAEDVEGTRFPIYAGPSELDLPGEPARTITTLRAPAFPYFDGTVKALGGNVGGLAGQSTFGRRRLVFDRSAGVLYVAPLDMP